MIVVKYHETYKEYWRKDVYTNFTFPLRIGVFGFGIMVMILPQVHLRKDHYHTSSPLASAGGNIETTVWQQMGVLSPADLYIYGDLIVSQVETPFCDG